MIADSVHAERPAPTRALLIGASVVGIFVLDLSIGAEVSSSIFYLIPIALATWSYSRGAGLVLSLASAILWLLGEVLLSVEYSNAVTPVWNMLVRLGFFVIVTFTLSARRRIEADLIRARGDALNATRAKSEFISRVTHELRTPLASILGFSDLLEKRSGPLMSHQDRESVKRIRVNAESLLSLVDGVLDLGIAEATTPATPVTAPVDLTDVVTAILADVRARRPTSQVQLIADLPERLAPLETDARLLHQVLLNLVSNAVKFTDHGHVRVGVVANAQAEPVEIFVEDTGIGIPAERMEAVFRPFEQGDGSIHARYGGVGLGLAITRDLCDRMGYQLKVDTTQGEGSRFTVVLPDK